MIKAKKLLAALLAASTTLSLAACGDAATTAGNDSAAPTKEAAATESTTAVASEGAEEANTDLCYEPYAEELNIKIGRLASQHTVSSLYPGDTLENNPYTRYVKEVLNISFTDEIEADDEDYKNQIALAAVSGDIPEMFTVTNYDTLVDLVENDLIEDLTDVYDQYADPYIKSIYNSYEGRCLDMVTFDGKLMALPGTNADNGVPTLVWMRKDWLDQIGLNPDEDGDLCIDIAAVEEAAKAFMDADISGKGTIGIAMSEGIGDSTWIANANGAFVDQWIDNGDGTISWSTTSEETKQTWALLNRWFEEGILDPQFGTRTWDDVTSLLIDNKCGIAFGAWHMPDWRFSHVKDANPEAEYIAYTLKDANGKVNTFHENPTNNFFVVRKGYEHPEAAVKIQNVIFAKLAKATEETAPEVMDFVKNGGDNFCRPIQMECLPADTRSVYYEDHQAVLAGQMKPEETRTAENQNSSKVMMEYLKDPEHVTEETRTGWSFYNSRITGLGASYGALLANGNANWISPLYPPTLDAMEQKKAALDTLESKAYIKIVTGEEPIEYFDQFVSDWNEYGGKDIIAELEEYYAEKNK